MRWSQGHLEAIHVYAVRGWHTRQWGSHAARCEKGTALAVARRLDFVGRARPTHVLSPRRHSPEAEGSLGGSSSSSMQRASSRRWPTAEGVRGAVRGRGARQAGAARCASQYAGCAAGASCAGVGLAQAGPASAAAACVARRGGLTIRFTVHCFWASSLAMLHGW